MRYSFSSASDCLLVLINDDSSDTFCSVIEKDGGLLASLFLGVNKRHIRKSDEPQNVAQVRLLKIESLSGRALFVVTPARSNHDNPLFCEKALRAVWSVTNGCPEPHNLINPRLERRRNGEVVHRRADDDRVRRREFFD